MNGTLDDPPRTERLAPAPATFAPGASGELVQRFEQAVVLSSTETLMALREAAIASGAAMRAGGMTPERAVMALKASLRPRHPSVWSPSLVDNRYAPTPPPEADVYRRLFGWWVAGYYEHTP